MKRTFENPEQVLGAVKVLIGQYSDNINTIEEEKYLSVKCEKFGNRFKVTFIWVCEIVRYDCVHADDYFFLLLTEDHIKLEKYVFDALALVTAHPVLVN